MSRPLSALRPELAAWLYTLARRVEPSRPVTTCQPDAGNATPAAIINFDMDMNWGGTPSTEILPTGEWREISEETE